MEMENTLVLNAGSSSVKFALFCGDARIIEGEIDRIGEEGRLRTVFGGEHQARSVRTKDFCDAGRLVLESLPSPPTRIVHRVVHGAGRGTPERITADLLAELWKLVPLAPLHLPPALHLIEFFSGNVRGAEMFACFDTAFHGTMPPVARNYAIPQDLARKHGIVRYGFHGWAHESMLHSAAALLGKPAGDLNLITCQVGSGVSMCAIRKGRSVDTTMGFTPLEGLVMGTRSGDIDPAVVEYLCEHEGMAPRDVIRILDEKSGLAALGGSHDVRDLLEWERKGDPDAKLALDLFSYRIRKQIGAYLAIIGMPDAIVLSGGAIHAPALRVSLLEGLGHLGIDLDWSCFWRDPPALICAGKIAVFVVEVDEARELLKAIP